MSHPEVLLAFYEWRSPVAVPHPTMPWSISRNEDSSTPGTGGNGHQPRSQDCSGFSVSGQGKAAGRLRRPGKPGRRKPLFLGSPWVPQCPFANETQSSHAIPRLDMMGMWSQRHCLHSECQGMVFTWCCLINPAPLIPLPPDLGSITSLELLALLTVEAPCPEVCSLQDSV